MAPRSGGQLSAKARSGLPGGTRGMSTLTPAQRSRNIAQVKQMVGRLASTPLGKLAGMLGTGLLPLEGLAIQQGGRFARLDEL